jgi:hypothetical protein
MLVPGVLPLLAVVGGVWGVWVLIAFLAFPVTSPVSMLLIAYPVGLMLIALAWRRILCAQDGVRPPGFFAISYEFNEYIRANADRFGKPLWLGLFGLAAFAANIGLFVLQERLGGPPAADQPALAPVAGAAPGLFQRGPQVDLADLPEFDARWGPWPFVKNGTVGNGRPIQVKGVASSHGLGMHPPDPPGYAAVKYRLNRQAAVFAAAVALNDTATDPKAGSAAVFEVFGDGRRLWESAPVGKAGQPQECRVDVRGVDVLELRVRAEGLYWSLHAVWVEPRILQKAG